MSEEYAPLLHRGSGGSTPHIAAAPILRSPCKEKRHVGDLLLAQGEGPVWVETFPSRGGCRSARRASSPAYYSCAFPRYSAAAYVVTRARGQLTKLAALLARASPPDDDLLFLADLLSLPALTVIRCRYSVRNGRRSGYWRR